MATSHHQTESDFVRFVFFRSVDIFPLAPWVPSSLGPALSGSPLAEQHFNSVFVVLPRKKTKTTTTRARWWRALKGHEGSYSNEQLLAAYQFFHIYLSSQIFLHILTQYLATMWPAFLWKSELWGLDWLDPSATMGSLMPFLQWLVDSYKVVPPQL